MMVSAFPKIHVTRGDLKSNLKTDENELGTPTRGQYQMPIHPRKRLHLHARTCKRKKLQKKFMKFEEKSW